MPFFLGSAPTIIPGVLKKDIKKITCKKYDRTLGVLECYVWDDSWNIMVLF